MFLKKKKQNFWVGIDLGTTNSCVAVYANNKVEVIENEYSKKTTPSWVSFVSENKVYVGESAVDRAPRNVLNTIYNSKRIIGRNYNDAECQAILPQLRYRVVQSDDGIKPLIACRIGNEVHKFRPDEISNHVIRTMKKLAENKVGQGEITSAVITVPAHFNDSQRQATKLAAEIAGITDCMLLNEPTAAAIAYALDNFSNKKRNILVYDIGGGTFDVSILSVEGKTFETIGTDGDPLLGGEDFNDRLIQHVIRTFNARNPNFLIDQTDYRILARIRNQIETKKIALSSNVTATLFVESIVGELDIDLQITRPQFEEMCRDLFDKTIVIVDQLFRRMRVKPKDISDIVMVGGSSKIPYLRKILQEYFGGKEPLNGINPDEAVAYGAAVRAALRDKGTQAITVFKDVTPLSLGVKESDGTMLVVIERNSQIPCAVTQHFKTSKDNQTHANILIYEGERVMAENNYFLGEMVLTGLPPLPRGQAKFVVTFTVNANGLQISAIGCSQRRKAKVSITIDDRRNQLSLIDVQRSRDSAQQFHKHDELLMRQSQAIHKLESNCYQMQRTLSTTHGCEHLSNVVTEILRWIENNPNATVKEIERKSTEIEQLNRDI